MSNGIKFCKNQFCKIMAVRKDFLEIDHYE